MYIETEVKYLLDKTDFRKLYKYLAKNCPKANITRQNNYYFDAKDLKLKNKVQSLEDNDLNLRIRLVKNKAELTIKVPIIETIEDNVISSYEYNREIDIADALYYIKNGLSDSNIRAYFGDISGVTDKFLQDIISYGCLRTTRIAFTLKENLPPILMDISRYLAVIDYEIEWELDETDRAKDILLDIFSDLNIRAYNATIPKRHRFFNRLKQIKE